MKQFCKSFFFLFPAFLLQMEYVKARNVTNHADICSPDGKLCLKIRIINTIVLYSIDFNHKQAIAPSGMGLTINGSMVGNAATGIIHDIRYKVNETYPYRGVHNIASNHYNASKIKFEQGKTFFTIDARVFNDGVAMRYLIDNKDSAIISKDQTQFVIPAASIVWSQPNINYYEGVYTKKLVDTITTGTLMGPPVTIEFPNGEGFAAITEGGLIDFAGMSLTVSKPRTLQANLSGSTRKNGDIQTPWRIIEIGKDLNTLVNCDIIANVSPPFPAKLFPRGYMEDWIKPGRSVWSWLAERRSVTLENMKRFTDLAAQLGFEYNLVDEGWGYWKDTINHRTAWEMMKDLVDYSATKGVKIWAWKAYPERKGIPGIQDAAQRKIFFKKCKDIGLVGLKIDFFNAESQEVINFYQAALKDAAEVHLMLDFHGANKPTGESRTWPNEMTREAIRGMENHPPWAIANTILPFTRYLAGPADFTPVHFGNRMGEVSWAHHIASMIIFTSPFLCLGADPQSIIDNPCRDIIKCIPPVWDETIVLPQSKIGDIVLFARRNKDVWFLAAMSASKEVRTIKVMLSFLKGSYKLILAKDDKDKQAGVIFENLQVNSDSTIKLTINSMGGFVGKFEKVN